VAQKAAVRQSGVARCRVKTEHILPRDAVGIFKQELHPTYRWTWEEQDATPAQFRKLIHESDLDDSVKLAVHAGKKMAKLLAHAGNSVRNLDASQIEDWRRRFGVQRNRVNVMLMVAWNLLYFPPKPIPRETKAVGEAAPRTAAKQMIANYGFLAEKMVRKMMRGGDETNSIYWKSVAREVRSIRAERTERAA
jgi:hypothetical protein